MTVIPGKENGGSDKAIPLYQYFGQGPERTTQAQDEPVTGSGEEGGIIAPGTGGAKLQILAFSPEFTNT